MVTILFFQLLHQQKAAVVEVKAQAPMAEQVAQVVETHMIEEQHQTTAQQIKVSVVVLVQLGLRHTELAVAAVRVR
jgi:hypothetical protein